MTQDLFADLPEEPRTETITEGALVLRGFVFERAEELLRGIQQVTDAAPLRKMQGWVTDATGYRYQAKDPLSGQPWPAMPEVFVNVARDAAEAAGFLNFQPDACLINQYKSGAKMGLHQDKDELDFEQPIVSVSLGLSQVFQFGGLKRNERPVNVPLAHGDVVVWGGPARLRYHGVLRLKAGEHPLTGDCRYNLTFRRAR